ncbi:hypothetical protein NX059_011946 [Plenodomus lindquistii]|nr:hypothetical protein NX059_011946 [Plenodomus lindquistii]
MSRQNKQHIVKTAHGRRKLSRPLSSTNGPRLTTTSALRSTTSRARPRPWIPLSIKGTTKLLQRTYTHFSTPIQIYHFASSFLTISNLRTLLARNKLGYVTTLYSPDPMIATQIVDGDEVPRGCMEVVYLDRVFRPEGSALGFRTSAGAISRCSSKDRDKNKQDDSVVEWFVFSRPLPEFVLHDIKIPRRVGRETKKRLVNSGRLFNHVADIEKMPEMGRMKKGKEGEEVDRGEYWAWWDVLLNAGHPQRRVRLSWKGWGRDVSALLERRNMDAKKKVDELRVEFGRTEGNEVSEEEEDDWDEEESEQDCATIGVSAEEDKDEDEDEATPGGISLLTPDHSDEDDGERDATLMNEDREGDREV